MKFNNPPDCYTHEKCRFASIGPASRTDMYYAPIYDREGKNLNADRNQTTQRFKCTTCDQTWVETW